MGALTWNKMTRNQNADLIKSLIANNQALGDSLSGLGETAKGYVTDRTEKETQDFVGQLMATDSIAERDAMIKAAEGQDYLNFQTIGEKSYELGTDERALETQLAAEIRAAEAEDIINTRELKEAKEAALFDANIQRGLNEDLFQNEQYLTNIQRINDLNLAEVNLDNDIKVAEKEAQLLEEKLDAQHEREKEEKTAEVLAEKEKALATAKSKAEELKITLEYENKLKEALDLQQKAYETEKLRIENVRRDNEAYRTEQAAIPSGLTGVYTKAAGGDKNYTAETVGYDQNDSNAYANMRSAVMKLIGIDGSDVRSVRDLDRWMAENITFHNNLGLLGADMNDFSFINNSGKTIRFGYGQQWNVNNSNEAHDIKAAFNKSKIASDIKDATWEIYQGLENGSGSVRAHDEQWLDYAIQHANQKGNPKSFHYNKELSVQGFRTYMASLLPKTRTD